MAARDFLHDDRTARPAIFTLVVAAHLAALLVPWDQRIRPTEWATRGILLLIPERTDAVLRASHEPDVDASATHVEAPPQPTLAPMYLPAESAIGSAMDPPDWKQSGADAAADAARDNYRALGPPPAEPKVKLPPPPFAPEPKHSYGEVDEDAQRNPIIWLSSNCWLRPRNFAADAGDPFARVPMTFCSFAIGKKQARGDLFEHLRKTPPAP